MLGVLVSVMILLVIVGLLVWAVSLLSGIAGFPHQLVLILQVLIVLVAVLYLLSMLGVFTNIRPHW